MLFRAVGLRAVLALRAVPPVLALRAPPDALAPEERLAVEADLARVDVDFLRVPVERFAVERFAPELDLAVRARDVLDEAEPLELSSSVHLPDRTRCAASATASAIREPSFEAFDTTLLAAA